MTEPSVKGTLSADIHQLGDCLGPRTQAEPFGSSDSCECRTPEIVAPAGRLASRS